LENDRVCENMEKKRISGTISLEDYKKIKRLVDEGRYKNISDFVRVAVRKLIDEEFNRIELDEKTLKRIKQNFGMT